MCIVHTCKHLKDWLGLSLRVRPLHTSTRFHQKSIKAYNTYGSAVHLGPTAKGREDPSDINCRLIMMAVALIPNFLELAWGECPWVISTLVPEPMDQLDHDKDITGQYDPEMLNEGRTELGLRELYQPSFVFKLWLHFISIESRDVVSIRD